MMDIDAVKRRLKESETERDILINQIVRVTEKINEYKEMICELESEAESEA